jgi:glucan phosphoethanolaminetransferase (alkaline phosphatase superfamily)|tara:strand:- start:222 stop:353 length:132 start_codon:yes stop_codon:yes gene_type:complete
MDPNTIQNKINKKANNGKLNDFDNSLNWVDGILKKRIIDIRII